MRKALGRLLRTHGYEVTPFEDGESFLAACTRRTFDCVLMDLHMPGVNGFAVLEAMQARAACPPIIVLTGHDEPGTEARVRQLGARAYLTKPVDETPLLGAIVQHLPAAARANRAGC